MFVCLCVEWRPSLHTHRVLQEMDDFLGAMEMVAEDVDAEIVEKNKGSCNAQMVNFHRVKMSTLILALVWWCI